MSGCVRFQIKMCAVDHKNKTSVMRHFMTDILTWDRRFPSLCENLTIKTRHYNYVC